MKFFVFLGIADSLGELVNSGLELFTNTENGIVSVLMQMTATLLLFLAVRFLLWNKVTEIIEERERRAQEAFDALNQAKLDTQAIYEKAEEDEKLAKAEAINIIEKAKEKSYLEAEEILNKANAEANSKIEKAKEEIDLEIKNANEKIKEEIVNTAYLLAEKIINEEIDKKDHEKLVSDFMEKVEANDK